MVRGVSREHGTTPEYPDLRRQDLSRAGGAGRSPTFRSTTSIESQANEAARTRLYRNTRSHPFGSDSCAANARFPAATPTSTARSVQQVRGGH